jgi:glycosyltransferase involved in cell wall biosynthesis
MRVLHVHSGNLYGGVESILVTLARHASLAADVTWQFALTHTGRLSAELTAAGAAPVVIGAARASRPWTVLAARGQLALHLDRAPCDVALVHSLWSLAAFGPVLRRAGVPVVAWVHGVAPSPAWLAWWAARSRPDAVIANSAFTGGHLPAALRTMPCTVVHPPAALAAPDPTARARVRTELNAHEGEVVLLHVSRLEPGKGHELLLDALGALPPVPAWRCWIAGGAQRPGERAFAAQLAARATARGLASRVSFLGERGDVPALLAAADVFVQPNTAPEGFGLALVEALAAGVPVAATRLGATPEIVDDRTAVLTEPGSAASLAAALRDLIADDGRRRALAANGPARARALSDPAVAIPRLAAALIRLRGAAR